MAIFTLHAHRILAAVKSAMELVLSTPFPADVPLTHPTQTEQCAAVKGEAPHARTQHKQNIYNKLASPERMLIITLIWNAVLRA